MSGYLEVKYPLKPNLGLNPFKSWKKQWCILRPSPTLSGGSLAVYCSEAGATAGSIELPSASVVKRAKSRSRPYAFAVFPVDDRKPRVLLAAQTLQEAQSWMDKIKALLNGENIFGTGLKDCFSITVLPTNLAQSMGLHGDNTVTVSAGGIQFTKSHHSASINWQYLRDIVASMENGTRICELTIDREHKMGGGSLKLSSQNPAELCCAIRSRRPLRGGQSLSKSDAQLTNCTDIEVRRSSWYSGPSEVSLDDIDLVMSKECPLIPWGQLSRCARAGSLCRSRSRPKLHSAPAAVDDSMSDRRSLLSVASGIYEEIPDLPVAADDAKENQQENNTVENNTIENNTLENNTIENNTTENNMYCKMGRDVPDGKLKDVEAAIRLEEPTYESVSECVYATMRRGKRPPPPLPPRANTGTMKLGSSWNSRMDSDVTRHGSLGSIPRCCSASSARTDPGTATLPHKTSRSFSVFRKRLKSDSRLVSPKSDTSKENKDIVTKKKKFDFTPTRDIFKNFKVSRKMKNLKITSCGSLSKGETKSCEFLDETEHVTTNRCSKSVECLENEFLDEFDGDLSIEFNDDAVAALALPQEIVDLILRNREQINKVRLKETQECEYLPMSPIVPKPPMEHHYIVMSPKSNVA